MLLHLIEQWQQIKENNNNVRAKYSVQSRKQNFKISTTSHVVHMLIFVILIRHINTKLLKSCSESQKLLKVAKIGKSSKFAQKLPSTICLGLVACEQSLPFFPRPTHSRLLTRGFSWLLQMKS